MINGVLKNIKTEAMDTSDWIAAGLFLISAGGLLLAFYKHKESIRKQLNDRAVEFQQKVNENALSIVRLEKEMLEMKRNHEKEIKEIKVDFTMQFGDMLKQNREDHQIIFKKLDEYTAKITKAATLIEHHLKV